MGGDGGVISTKRAYMRETNMGKKDEKEAINKNELRDTKVRTCAMSGEPLREPIVACRLGNLYNKDAVLGALIARSEGKSAQFGHIRKMKDVVGCVLTAVASDDPAAVAAVVAAAAAAGGGASEAVDATAYHSVSNAGQFMCPITRDEFNGNHPFCVIWASGAVVSQKALDQVPSETCLVTGKPFSAADVFRLAPDEGELLAMRQREAARRAEEKRSKKSSKHAARAVTAAAAAAASSSGGGGAAVAAVVGAPGAETATDTAAAAAAAPIAPDGGARAQKKRKRAANASGGAAAASSSATAEMAKQARQAVADSKAKAGGGVYSSLFSKPAKYTDKKTLMMATATHRYTLA